MARISDEELNNSVTKINSKKNKPVSKVILYDKAGNETDVLPKDQIMALQRQENKITSYHVRVNRDKELYNPYDKLWVENSYRIARRDALDPFTMMKTNKVAFEEYINFLKTGKDVYLRKAQGNL